MVFSVKLRIVIVLVYYETKSGFAAKFLEHSACSDSSVERLTDEFESTGTETPRRRSDLKKVTLKQVLTNSVKRCRACKRANGGRYFPRLL